MRNGIEALVEPRDKRLTGADIEVFWPVMQQCEVALERYSDKEPRAAQELWGHLVCASERIAADPSDGVEMTSAGAVRSTRNRHARRSWEFWAMSVALTRTVWSPSSQPSESLCDAHRRRGPFRPIERVPIALDAGQRVAAAPDHGGGCEPGIGTA